MKKIAKFFGVFAGALIVGGCGGKDIGLREDGLAPCPNSSNCVSSQAADEKHRIAPLTYKGSRAEALEKLNEIVANMDRATIITDTEYYLHAEFRSRWFKFVDDVEFWMPDDKAIIHIRSASRVGYSDFGVNRKRAERIRASITSSVSSQED